MVFVRVVVVFFLFLGFLGVEVKLSYLVLIYFKCLYKNGLIVDVKDLWYWVYFMYLIFRYFLIGVILEVILSLVENGVIVNVFWRGIFRFDSYDFIVFYCFKDSFFGDYLDYFYVFELLMYIFGCGW